MTPWVLKEHKSYAGSMLANMSYIRKMNDKSLKDRLKHELIVINRSPLLTLWVAIVAEREGNASDDCFKAGKAIAQMLALARGRSLGIFDASDRRVTRANKGYKRIAGFKIPVAMLNVSPDSVRRGLQRSFGKSLEIVSHKLMSLARQYDVDEIGKHTYRLYEQFRPVVAEGLAGWGQRSVLDLKTIDRLIRKARTKQI